VGGCSPAGALDLVAVVGDQAVDEGADAGDDGARVWPCSKALWVFFSPLEMNQASTRQSVGFFGAEPVTLARPLPSGPRSGRVMVQLMAASAM